MFELEQVEKVKNDWLFVDVWSTNRWSCRPKPVLGIWLVKLVTRVGSVLLVSSHRSTATSRDIDDKCTLVTRQTYFPPN